MKNSRFLFNFIKFMFFCTVLVTALTVNTSETSACCGGGGSSSSSESESEPSEPAGGDEDSERMQGGGESSGDIKGVMAPPPPPLIVVVPVLPNTEGRECSWDDIRCDIALQDRIKNVMLNLLKSYYSMNGDNQDQVELMSELAARVVGSK